MIKMIKIPNCKFPIGSVIIEKNSNIRIEHIIYDISYSLATGEWYYRYSYWIDGYKYYCKSPIKCVEKLFEVAK